LLRTRISVPAQSTTGAKSTAAHRLAGVARAAPATIKVAENDRH
jgi:hypothetical protein